MNENETISAQFVKFLIKSVCSSLTKPKHLQQLLFMSSEHRSVVMTSADNSKLSIKEDYG